MTTVKLIRISVKTANILIVNTHIHTKTHSKYIKSQLSKIYERKMHYNHTGLYVISQIFPLNFKSS